MSQEAVPEETVPQQSAPQSAAERKGTPKGLLQQMEEAMAALNADLTQLDADLQSTADRTPPADGPGEAQQTYGSEEPEQRVNRENR
ncbi:hypothetical protein ACIBCO_36410 [Streptomyces violascens]|uniref:hypothetical protein n=1 Tax=Streptomyces violascens TaxID=67381 RepID=UPI0037BB6B1A